MIWFFVFVLHIILHGLFVYLFIFFLILHGVYIIRIMGYILVGGLILLFMYHTSVCISCCPYNVYSFLFLLVMFCVPISFFTYAPGFSFAHLCVF